MSTPPERIPAFCPNCGAANTSHGLRCVVCGHEFLGREHVAAMWDLPGSRSEPAETVAAPVDDNIDRFADVPAGEEDAIFATRPMAPITDRWSSAAGRLAEDPGSANAFIPPVDMGPKRDAGPPAVLLGLLGFILILAVAAAAVILVIGPLVSTHVETRTRKAVQSSLADVAVLPTPTTGTVVITEAQIRTTLKTHAAALQPVEHPVVQLNSHGFAITFEVYGYKGTLTGTLGVRDGRLIIVDPKLDGLADRVLDVDAIASDVEVQLNALLDRNGLQVTSVQTTDDTITVMTAPKAT